MSEEKKCPICHHIIIDPDRGNQGSHGVDENQNPKPFWTDDSLLTPKGLSATEWDEELVAKNWVGIDNIKVIHIIELQDYYKELEEQSLVLEDRTNWEQIENESLFKVKRIHIEQLRASVEKLLISSGKTLEDYFNYNYLGEAITFPYMRYGILVTERQINWTNPDLTKITKIKAIHIEELRIGLQIMWIETWTKDNPYFYNSWSGSSPPGISPADEVINNFVNGDHPNWRFKERRMLEADTSGNSVVDLSNGSLKYNAQIIIPALRVGTGIIIFEIVLPISAYQFRISGMNLKIIWEGSFSSDRRSFPEGMRGGYTSIYYETQSDHYYLHNVKEAILPPGVSHIRIIFRLDVGTTYAVNETTFSINSIINNIKLFNTNEPYDVFTYQPHP